MSLEQLRKVLDGRRGDRAQEAARREQLISVWAQIAPRVSSAVRIVNETLEPHGQKLLAQGLDFFGKDASGYGVQYLFSPMPSGYHHLPAVVTGNGTLWVGGLHHWSEGATFAVDSVIEQNLVDTIAATVASMIED